MPPLFVRQIATTLIFTIAVACNFSSWMHHVGAAQWYADIAYIYRSYLQI